MIFNVSAVLVFDGLTSDGRSTAPELWLQYDNRTAYRRDARRQRWFQGTFISPAEERVMTSRLKRASEERLWFRSEAA